MSVKVLVVDNHPVMLQYMTDILSAQGCDIRTAQDGLDALSVLGSFVPDVAFVDLVMPNIDGRKLSRIMRSRPELKKTRIVILSAVAAEASEEQALAFADVCIAKGPLAKMKPLVLQALEGHGRGTLGLDHVCSRQITRELLSTRDHAEALLTALTEAVLELTPDGFIVAANTAAAELFAVGEEELLSRRFEELFSEAQTGYVEQLLAASSGSARRSS